MKRLLVATVVFASVATISQAQLRSSASAPSGSASSANVSGWHAGSPFIGNTQRSQARTFPVRPPRDVAPQICTPLGGCFRPTFPWTTTIGQSDFDRRDRHNDDFRRAALLNGWYGLGAPYYFPQNEAELSDFSDYAERATADREQMMVDLQDQRRMQELARQYAELHAADANSAAQSPAGVAPGQTSTPVEPPGPALLILRDGRRVQIENYAVTRNKILTFGSNAQPTIMMSEVDVPATLKANQEAGFKFAIPGMRQ